MKIGKSNNTESVRHATRSRFHSDSGVRMKLLAGADARPFFSETLSSKQGGRP